MENGLISLQKLANDSNITHFNIPKYQRGYRWQAEKEVLELLKDLYEFFLTRPDEEELFYCLQPLVVKAEQSSYNVLDGQQRLTTFFLIYKYLFQKELFKITYETRLESKDFLINIQNKTEKEASDNIDFFHFYEAYKRISVWFEESKDRVDLFSEYFLSKAKVIWHEVDENENEIDVFLRLNIGKIPLTNAELIKAIFLSKSDDVDSSDLEERADTWYNCEIDTRDNNDNAYCLYNNIKNKNDILSKNGEVKLNDDISRIEMYFALLSQTENTTEEPQAIFKYFYELTKKEGKEEIWKKFEDIQTALLGYAKPSLHDTEGRILYHYLGFLVICESKQYTMQNLLVDIKELGQEQIIEKIKNIIITNLEKVKLDELNYHNNRKRLNEILLLFNLEDLNQDKCNAKDFEFNRYKMQEWSLEHIIPQSIKNKKDFSIMESWIQDLKELYSDDTEIIDQLEYITAENFQTEIDELVDILNRNDFINHISNLVLLDKVSNTQLGDANFARKSDAVSKLSNSNKLIPQCTGAIFKKAYSTERTDPSIWTKHDREQYLDKIYDTLIDFIPRKSETEDE